MLPRLGLCLYDLHQLRTARNEVGERGRTAAEKKNEALRAPLPYSTLCVKQPGGYPGHSKLQTPTRYKPTLPRSFVLTPLPRGRTAATATLRADANRRYRGASRSPARHPLTCVYVLPSEKTARELGAAALRLTPDHRQRLRPAKHDRALHVDATATHTRHLRLV